MIRRPMPPAYASEGLIRIHEALCGLIGPYRACSALNTRLEIGHLGAQGVKQGPYSPPGALGGELWWGTGGCEAGLSQESLDSQSDLSFGQGTWGALSI